MTLNNNDYRVPLKKLPSPNLQGFVPLDKMAGVTSFTLVTLLRKITSIKKIGHAGTLDPFASGVMILLIGKEYTKQASILSSNDKTYLAKLHLGITTDTFDVQGKVVSRNEKVPALKEVMQALSHFQGKISQVPPMFSAKKIQGKKLYELARKNISIDRAAQTIYLKTSLISYNYPYLDIEVECSKGTYIRSLADEIGKALACGAHLTQLIRTQSGPFYLKNCVELLPLLRRETTIENWIHTSLPPFSKEPLCKC